MTNYKYRLTIVFVSTRQWKIGVESMTVGESIGRELARNAGDVFSVCLSDEKTGEVIWHRRGSTFSN